jgi:hypothetical protein
MVKCTLEQQIFLFDSCMKRNSHNCVKEGSIISILVFHFQLNQ